MVLKLLMDTSAADYTIKAATWQVAGLALRRRIRTPVAAAEVSVPRTTVSGIHRTCCHHHAELLLLHRKPKPAPIHALSPTTSINGLTMIFAVSALRQGFSEEQVEHESQGSLINAAGCACA
jgi:hypothetical protein